METVLQDPRLATHNNNNNNNYNYKFRNNITMSPNSFDDDASPPSPSPEDDDLLESDEEDEEQLIKDGNDEVLQSFENRKKSREYSRSQYIRDKKAPELSMDFVDFGSGFSSAAHRSPGSVTGRKIATGGRSGRLTVGSAANNGAPHTPKLTESTGRLHARSQLRKLAATDAGGEVEGEGEEGQEGLNDTSSPRKERYRNRRHSLKGTGSGGGLTGSNHGSSHNTTPGKEGHEDLNDTTSSPKKYRNRRHSFKGTGLSTSLHGGDGTQALSRKPSLTSKGSSLSTGGNGRVRPTRRKSPQRRKSDSAMKERARSLRGSNHRSSSPSSRIRAAASTLHVDGGTSTKRTPQRNGSLGRKQRSQRDATGSSRALKVADDGVIASKSTSIKW